MDWSILNNLSPDFDLACPKCGARCVGKTAFGGTRGTYREVYARWRVWRIVCAACGLLREQPDPTQSLEHRYWFRLRIGQHILWAESESRLRTIRAVLSGETSNDHSALYALPRWLTQRRA